MACHASRQPAISQAPARLHSPTLTTPRRQLLAPECKDRPAAASQSSGGSASCGKLLEPRAHPAWLNTHFCSDNRWRSCFVTAVALWLPLMPTGMRRRPCTDLPATPRARTARPARCGRRPARRWAPLTAGGPARRVSRPRRGRSCGGSGTPRTSVSPYAGCRRRRARGSASTPLWNGSRCTRR